MRVPAPAIEHLVTDRIRQLFGEPASLIEAAEPFRLEAATQRDLLGQAAELAATWSTLQPGRIRLLLTSLVRRIELGSDRIELHTSPRHCHVNEPSRLLPPCPPISGQDNRHALRFQTPSRSPPTLRAYHDGLT